MADEISYSHFEKLELRTGTIINAELNAKARVPAYRLEIDFGDVGIKTSSAQLTDNYQAEDLKGKQIIAVMNFPAKRIAGVKSEVLVLGAVCPKQGTVILLTETSVQNGVRIA